MYVEDFDKMFIFYYIIFTSNKNSIRSKMTFLLSLDWWDTFCCLFFFLLIEVFLLTIKLLVK